MELRDEAYREVSAQLAGSVTSKSDLLVWLIRVQVVPLFVIAVFGAHLHTILDMEVEELIRRALRCDEAIDEDLLVDRKHTSHTTVPDWRTLVLVEWTALHGVVEHVFKLGVRDRVQLPGLSFVVPLLILVLSGEGVFNGVDGARVDVAFVVDEHVN